MSDNEHSEKHEEGHGSKSHGPPHGGGHEGGHEGAPEWLISFADNVALMMGFFVILLAMNMGPKGSSVNNTGEPGPSSDQAAREADFVLGIREAFRNPVDRDGMDPGEEHLRRRIRDREGGPARDEAPEGNAPSQQAIRPSDYNRITASIGFDENQSVLSSQAKVTIAQAAKQLRDKKWIIEIRGHVSPFESMRNVRKAMQLSHERAMSVALALGDVGVKWENIRIVACGDHDRLVPKAADREADQSNRRVEIVETNDSISPDPYSHENAAPKDEPQAPADEPESQEAPGHD